MRGLFVTGTDTGAGKTILSAALLAAMAADGERVSAYKPVLTGLDEPARDGAQAVWPTDDVLLARASGGSPQEVAPLRYGPPVSPHLAAELAGERIDPARLLARAHAAARGDAVPARSGQARSAARNDARAQERTIVVEGVGGLLTPLCPNHSARDFAVALKLPVLIAARPGLGTISHTLLTIEAARAVGLRVRAVVLTPWPDRPARLERSNRETIARLGAVEVEALAPVRRPARGDLALAGARLPWRRWLSDSRPPSSDPPRSSDPPSLPALR